MKRAAPWEAAFDTSSDDSSGSDSDDGPLSKKKGVGNISKGIKSEESKKRKGGMNYEALSKHGYRGGPSILKVPPPKIDDKDLDWSWSKGKRETKEEANEESYQERQKTRAISQGEHIIHFQKKENNNQSFSQKEKRKRDLGQASRGKNYVEEEKRLLRESGVYSGFD